MSEQPGLDRFEPLIGEWSVAMVPVGADRPEPLPDVGARISWEWMGDRAFVLQRWAVPVEGAPSGLALIGWDVARERYLQHYFDDRGVARVYEADLTDGVLTLSRSEADFSPLDFAQRYAGRLADDGGRIDGTWEIAHEAGSWEKDFDLVYTRLA